MRNLSLTVIQHGRHDVPLGMVANQEYNRFDCAQKETVSGPQIWTFRLEKYEI